MKTKDIKNGSLYFNLKRDRVERVISNTFSNSRVVTECHKQDQVAVPSKNLRLASAEEVDNYLTPPPKRGVLSFLFGKRQESSVVS
jgi:hypothetical protein|tara:strand:- start:122 stop:379 length:258 start_codon:yes stop_codon:yes gene_type:complete